MRNQKIKETIMFKVKKYFIYFTTGLMLLLILGCGGVNTTEEISAGKPFTVFFDVDYDVFSKGSTFEVQLKNGKFEATGIHKGRTSPETSSYVLTKSGNPNRISVWGAEFQYDKDNHLLLNNKIIGRLVIK